MGKMSAGGLVTDPITPIVSTSPSVQYLCYLLEKLIKHAFKYLFS